MSKSESQGLDLHCLSATMVNYPIYSMPLGRPPPPPAAEFPKNATEFMVAINELFSFRHPFFVMERDDSDGTSRIEWVDRFGKRRQSWVTGMAMQELTRDWVWN